MLQEDSPSHIFNGEHFTHVHKKTTFVGVATLRKEGLSRGLLFAMSNLLRVYKAAMNKMPHFCMCAYVEQCLRRMN